MLLINQFSWETPIIIQVPNLLKQGVSDLIQISDSFNENAPLISNTQCVELVEMQFNLHLTSALSVKWLNMPFNNTKHIVKHIIFSVLGIITRLKLLAHWCSNKANLFH